MDAGHGGHDSGNIGNGYKESEIALNVVLKVGAELEKLPNVKVIYTRKTNVFVELRGRAAIANEADADLFVSVHCNAHRSEAYGAETFVLGLHKSQANFEVAKKENEVIYLEDNYQEKYGGFDPNSPEGLIELSLRQNAHIHQSLKFAKEVQDQMRERVGRIDRGVRQAPYWVISFTTMPSVLVELGFLTNKEEEDFLMSSQGQDYTASAIYRAFKSYKTNMEILNEAKIAEAENTEANEANASDSETKSPKGVIFKVQLLSSSVKVELKPGNFKGLENVTEYTDNGMYKYLYGAASTYEGAKNLQKGARQSGYKGAFVVAFDENNNRIALEKALKLTN